MVGTIIMLLVLLLPKRLVAEKYLESCAQKAPCCYEKAEYEAEYKDKQASEEICHVCSSQFFSGVFIRHVVLAEPQGSCCRWQNRH